MYLKHHSLNINDIMTLNMMKSYYAMFVHKRVSDHVTRAKCLDKIIQ